jgi:hypothetical protein
LAVQIMLRMMVWGSQGNILRNTPLLFTYKRRPPPPHFNNTSKKKSTPPLSFTLRA